MTFLFCIFTGRFPRGELHPTYTLRSNTRFFSQSESITTGMFKTLANILLATAATLCWQAASGVPARRGAIICTQPDGTTITVERMGDEHFHIFVTADDRIPVQRTADGQFRYLNSDGTLSSVAAHNPGTRTQAEAEFLRTNGGGADFATLSAAAAQRRRAAAPQSRAASRASQVPFSGSPRVPILLVSYSDVDFLDKQNAHTTFERFFQHRRKKRVAVFLRPKQRRIHATVRRLRPDKALRRPCHIWRQPLVGCRQGDRQNGCRSLHRTCIPDQFQGL